MRSVISTARKAPGPLVRAAAGGTQYERVLALQQTAGNRAVSIALRGGAANVNLHGETTGDFDGGESTVSTPTVARAKGCDCADEEPCLRGTGTITIKYKVDVTIRMPDMPEGLSDCQQGRVTAFLRNVLAPHEQEHARRFRAYNGTTVRPYSITGCGRAGLQSELETQLEKMHSDEATTRADAAKNSSAAIDPFNKRVDLDC